MKAIESLGGLPANPSCPPVYCAFLQAVRESKHYRNDESTDPTNQADQRTIVESGLSALLDREYVIGIVSASSCELISRIIIII
jgi:hypothetical protein